MEPEIAVQPTTIVEPAPPVAPLATAPKKTSKLLYAFIGFAVILFSIALAIVFFGKGTTTSTDTNTSSNGEVTQDTSAWPTYQNVSNFYELSIPPKWTEIKRSPLFDTDVIFNALDTASLNIMAGQEMTSSLEEYLTNQDSTYKDIIKSTKSSQVKVGAFDGIERQESWPKVGLQSIVTYVKIQDMFYIFVLTPSGGKNAITNETIIRDYHTALASFNLTDKSKLGQDLKEYSSKKVDGLAFKAFSLKYPQSWMLAESTGENSLDVSIYRNNYELTISQKAIGGAVCLFSDSPAFEGSSGDLRNKQFSEFNTALGSTLRRYFNVNAGDKSSMFFCEKQLDGPYFQTPLTIGGLVYNVPAKYDADIIKEMDEIVKSIAPAVATESALTQ